MSKMRFLLTAGLLVAALVIAIPACSVSVSDAGGGGGGGAPQDDTNQPGDGGQDDPAGGDGQDGSGDGGDQPAETEQGGPEPVEFSEDAAGATSTMIAAEIGGTVIADGDVRGTLSIPPGALPADTEVSLTMLSDPAGDPYTILGQFEPDGLELAEPATLAIFLDPPLPAGQSLNVLVVPSDDPDILVDAGLSAEVSADGTFATIEVEHFSGAGCRLNCHGHSMRRIAQGLIDAGWTRAEIMDQVRACIGDRLAASGQDVDAAYETLADQFDGRNNFASCSAGTRELQAYLNTFYRLEEVRLNAQLDANGRPMTDANGNALLTPTSAETLSQLSSLARTSSLPPILNFGQGFSVGGGSDQNASSEDGAIFFDRLPHSAPIVVRGNKVVIENGTVMSNRVATQLQIARNNAGQSAANEIPRVVAVDLDQLDRFRGLRSGQGLSEELVRWGVSQETADELVAGANVIPWPAVRVWVPRENPADWCEDVDEPDDGGQDQEEPGYTIFRITNYGSQPDGYLTILTEDRVDDPPLLRSYPGGGIDPELRAELSPLNGQVFETREAAADSICSGFTRFFRPVLASFILAAEWNGEQVGVDSVFQSRCEE